MGKTIDLIVENVSIVDIADQGNAIGKDSEGKVYLVENAVPGDLMDIELRKHRRRLSVGRSIKNHHLSELRSIPFCEHFGICGGCKWQHMDYAAQLIYKQKNVSDALIRIGGIKEPAIRAIVGADNDQYYRNKLEFSFGNSRWLTAAELNTELPLSKNALGFHRPGSFEKIVDIHHCYLQADPSNKIRNFLKNHAIDKNYSFYDVRNHTGLFRNVMIRTSSNGQTMVVLVYGENQEDAIEEINQSLLNSVPEITTLYHVINLKKNDSIFDQEPILISGPGYITDHLRHLICRIGPKSFFQTNTLQATKLYSLVEEFANLQGHETVFDLYSGTGTIGLFLANKAGQIIAVEEIKEAVEDAKLNAQENKIENIIFHTGDVKKHLESGLLNASGKADLVILDPPRVGLHPDIIPVLNEAKIEKIIYVSCNPSTQARDLKLLSAVYDHIISQPVDMFPHTSHIENVTLLQLKK